MKFTVTLKDPDAFYDAVEDACKNSLAASDLPKDEQKLLLEARVEKTWNKIGKWVDCKEYIQVEFDTDDGTATVVEYK